MMYVGSGGTKWSNILESMMGSFAFKMKLYDLRLLQRGAVQCYEGHVNSHTRIQMGVDPSERFVMSGRCCFSDVIYLAF